MVSLSSPGTGRARALLAGTCLFTLLPIPFVIMRLWARRIVRIQLCFNDYAIIAGLVFAIGFNVNTMVTSIRGGYGQHIRNVSWSELEVSEKCAIASTFLWPSANTCVKLSVLHFYKRTFCIKKVAYACYIIAVLVGLYWLGTIITAFAICSPFNYNWNPTVKGHCGSKNEYYLSTAIINLLLDVMIVVLPLPVLWTLHTRLRRKVALTFIFSLGAGICGISIMRCYAIATLDDSDITYSETMDAIASELEPTLGVINACLPILAPVATKFAGTSFYSWFSSIHSSMSSTRRLIFRSRNSSSGESKKPLSQLEDSDQSTIPSTTSRWLPSRRSRN